MTKQISAFLAPEILRDIFSGLSAMKYVLGIGETPPALEQSFKAATKLKRELRKDIEMETVPLMELSSLADDIHVKTRHGKHHKIVMLICKNF